MVTVESDGAYLIFFRDNVEFYDSGIPCEAALGQWVRHMDDKMWFAEVRRETLRLLRDCYGWVA
jgi:hypothetical protein